MASSAPLLAEESQIGSTSRSTLSPRTRLSEQENELKQLQHRVVEKEKHIETLKETSTGEEVRVFADDKRKFKLFSTPVFRFSLFLGMALPLGILLMGGFIMFVDDGITAQMVTNLESPSSKMPFYLSMISMLTATVVGILILGPPGGMQKKKSDAGSQAPSTNRCGLSPDLVAKAKSMAPLFKKGYIVFLWLSLVAKACKEAGVIASAMGDIIAANPVWSAGSWVRYIHGFGNSFFQVWLVVSSNGGNVGGLIDVLMLIEAYNDHLNFIGVHERKFVRTAYPYLRLGNSSVTNGYYSQKGSQKISTTLASIYEQNGGLYMVYMVTMIVLYLPLFCLWALHGCFMMFCYPWIAFCAYVIFVLIMQLVARPLAVKMMPHPELSECEDCMFDRASVVKYKDDEEELEQAMYLIQQASSATLNKLHKYGLCFSLGPREKPTIIIDLVPCPFHKDILPKRDAEGVVQNPHHGGDGHPRYRSVYCQSLRSFFGTGMTLNGWMFVVAAGTMLKFVFPLVPLMVYRMILTGYWNACVVTFGERHWYTYLQTYNSTLEMVAGIVWTTY